MNKLVMTEFILVTPHSPESNNNRFTIAKYGMCFLFQRGTQRLQNVCTQYPMILEFFTRYGGDNEGATDLGMLSWVHSLVEPDSSPGLLAEVESLGCL